MRAPDDARSGPRRRLSRRGRIAVTVLAATVVVLFLSLRGIAGVYTDFLWFGSVGLSSVWTGILGARIALGVIFTGAFFVLLWANLLIAERLAPRFRPIGPEEELLERYHAVVGRRKGIVRAAVAFLFALVAGVGVSAQWESWLLFTNRTEFGVTDPLFGLDIGFYVFQLPFLSFLVDWLFAAFLIVLIVTVAAHYLNGGIRVQVPGQRVTAQVKAHLSVLLGMLALVRAAGYMLARYELTVSQRGVVDGASYTDVTAQLPALNLLVMISLFSFVLLLFNIKRRGWALPVVGVGLWVLSSVVVGTTYPWFVQRFLVEARGESAKEQPYIERNIAATRDAYGLDEVTESTFDAAGLVDAASVEDASDAGVFRNVRLVDPDLASQVLNRRQAQLGYYDFPDELDVDRYLVDGVSTLSLIGSRELNPAGIPQQSWEGQRLIYTQGYGVVVSPLGEVVNGEPNYVLGGISPAPIEGAAGRTDLDLTQPRLYFSESSAGYAVVNTTRDEIAFEGDQFSYDGSGGVQLGSIVRRGAFALRFGEFNLFASGFITPESRILYNRDVRERVAKVAPFVRFDGNPYPVVAEGRVVYVIDGYTTTDRYPYAQLTTTDVVGDAGGLRSRFNYVRNSVKAVVDAYDGSVDLYLVPGADGQVEPIARAYAAAFPDLFRPLADMPASVRDHLRHPEDLFSVQTAMFATYHVTDAASFYNRTGRWAVAPAPITDVSDRTVSAPPATTVLGDAVFSGATTSAPRVAPQYQLTKLPGEDALTFALTRPFVPISERGAREEMTAFMAAKPDGSLVVYRLGVSDAPGPTLLTSRILSDSEISQRITLLGSTGSQVLLGNRVLLTVGDALVWVTPLYVSAASASSGVPVLTEVIVTVGNTMVMAPTLGDALREAFGTTADIETMTGTAPTSGGPASGGSTSGGSASSGGPSSATTTVTTPGATTTTIAGASITDTEALQRAATLLEEADAALLRGDLAAYQRKVNEARALLATKTTRSGSTQ